MERSSCLGCAVSVNGFTTQGQCSKYIGRLVLSNKIVYGNTSCGPNVVYMVRCHRDAERDGILVLYIASILGFGFFLNYEFGKTRF